MSPGTEQLVSGLFSGAATLALAAIARTLFGIRQDVKRFVHEHGWLIQTSRWTRDGLGQVMAELGLKPTSEPPADLPPRNTR